MERCNGFSNTTIEIDIKIFESWIYIGFDRIGFTTKMHMGTWIHSLERKVASIDSFRNNPYEVQVKNIASST